jgi:asparagine synthetase B (glutamine-hydrolysing)
LQPQAIPLTRLELAAGVALGESSPVAIPPPAGGPLAALEQAIAVALAREPCMVSFSGGTDSSVVLAVAVRVARDRHLATPVPVSLRFPGVASTEESSWQELVIAHLGVPDWIRIEIGAELDFLGQSARAMLSKYGLLWPANAHFHAPIFVRAAGGSVLTGLDGDGLFGGWRWQRAQSVIARRNRPQPRDAIRVALALAPESVRAPVLAGRQPLAVTWLRPSGRGRLVESLARELASEPRAWPARVPWFARRRYLELGLNSLSLLAGEHRVEIHHPLLAPGFLAAVARDGGNAGYGSRAEALRALFGAVLPAELLGRRTKAEFGAALWGPEARAFAAGWTGADLDYELVDADLLREAWMAPNPPLAAATVLQHLWLESSRRARDQAR